MKAAASVYVFAVFTVVVTSVGRASIEGSKHDFRSQGAGSGTTGSRKEICAFCHTPVGRETVPEAPLWSPGTQELTFQRLASFGTATLDQDDRILGPVSLTCLACHDGTQAPDVIHNRGSSVTAKESLEPNYTVSTSEIALLPLVSTGTASDHPVGISYAGGACEGVQTDCDPRDMVGGNPDFNVAQFDFIDETASWWIDTALGVPGLRDKSDIILYAQDFDGTVGPAVECGSCHDPHEGEEQPVSFLRLPTDGSALCLACHVK